MVNRFGTQLPLLGNPAAVQRGRPVLSGVARRRYPEFRQGQLLGDRLQIGAHRDRIGVSVGRVAGSCTCHQLIELWRYTVDYSTGTRHVSIKPLVGNRQGRVAGERCVPR
ncbi:Uncharacterised protein [Mycobacterium tuberculosis]|nr:Uncharacterised protein [Mycobacterium tuberculosis]